MRRVNKVGKVLLQVAAIGIFLNATAAYGACNMTMYASDTGTEERMPCHGVGESVPTQTAASDVDFENCCSACVPVAIFANLGVAAAIAANMIDSKSELVLVSNGFDPPFRPPIAKLS